MSIPTSTVFGSMVVAAAAMLLMSGERWHSDASSRPASLQAGEGVRVLVVFHETDCPEDLQSVERFIAMARDRGLPAHSLLIVPRRPGPSGLGLSGRPAGERSIHRAILRAGIPSTPVVLLVDGRGIVRFAHPLAGTDPADHPGEAVAALGAMAGLLAVGEALPPSPEGE
jgi:hypothetical protein